MKVLLLSLLYLICTLCGSVFSAICSCLRSLWSGTLLRVCLSHGLNLLFQAKHFGRYCLLFVRRCSCRGRQRRLRVSLARYRWPCATWLLQFLCRRGCRGLLIQHLMLMSTGILALIWKSAFLDNKLLWRFANHWISFNSFIAGTIICLSACNSCLWI